MTKDIQTKAQGLLSKFVSSVQVLVEDITALEVNTMVVNEIKASKFNAWEAYQEIYSIHDKDYFAANEIPDPDNYIDPDDCRKAKDLRQRYKQLFSQLEQEYFYLLLEMSDPDQSQDSRIKQYQKRLAYIAQHKPNIVETDEKYIELARPILPAPTPVPDVADNDQKSWSQRWLEINKLLKNDKFVRTLRKVAELKAALDGGQINSIEIDTIYAQTVMQLDGDIINRYHKALFMLPEDNKNLILKIHNEGVVAGEQQWHGVLNFLVNLVYKIANYSLSLNERK